VAWIVATLCYQLGTFFQHPATSLFWVSFCVAIMLAVGVGLRICGRRWKRGEPGESIG
jgi:ferrous iron transport protein B